MRVFRALILGTNSFLLLMPNYPFPRSIWYRLYNCCDCLWKPVNKDFAFPIQRKLTLVSNVICSFVRDSPGWAVNSLERALTPGDIHRLSDSTHSSNLDPVFSQTPSCQHGVAKQMWNKNVTLKKRLNTSVFSSCGCAMHGQLRGIWGNGFEQSHFSSCSPKRLTCRLQSLVLGWFTEGHKSVHPGRSIGCYTPWVHRNMTVGSENILHHLTPSRSAFPSSLWPMNLVFSSDEKSLTANICGDGIVFEINEQLLTFHPRSPCTKNTASGLCKWVFAKTKTVRKPFRLCRDVRPVAGATTCSGVSAASSRNLLDKLFVRWLQPNGPFPQSFRIDRTIEISVGTAVNAQISGKFRNVTRRPGQIHVQNASVLFVEWWGSGTRKITGIEDWQNIPTEGSLLGSTSLEQKQTVLIGVSKVFSSLEACSTEFHVKFRVPVLENLVKDFGAAVERWNDTRCQEANFYGNKEPKMTNCLLLRLFPTYHVEEPFAWKRTISPCTRGVRDTKAGWWPHDLSRTWPQLRASLRICDTDCAGPFSPRNELSIYT